MLARESAKSVFLSSFHPQVSKSTLERYELRNAPLPVFADLQYIYVAQKVLLGVSFGFVSVYGFVRIVFCLVCKYIICIVCDRNMFAAFQAVRMFSCMALLRIVSCYFRWGHLLYIIHSLASIFGSGIARNLVVRCM